MGKRVSGVGFAGGRKKVEGREEGEKGRRERRGAGWSVTFDEDNQYQPDC